MQLVNHVHNFRRLLTIQNNVFYHMVQQFVYCNKQVLLFVQNTFVFLQWQNKWLMVSATEEKETLHTLVVLVFYLQTSFEI